MNGGPLGFGLEQEKQHGLQDAGHVAEGQRPHQPALGRGPDGAVRAGQAVEHDEQGPGGGMRTVRAAGTPSGSFTRPGLPDPGRRGPGPLTLLSARVSGGKLLKIPMPRPHPKWRGQEEVSESAGISLRLRV